MIYKNRKGSGICGEKEIRVLTRNIDAEFQKQYRTAPFREFRLTAFIAAPLLSLGFFPLPSFAFLTRLNVTLSPLFFVFEFGPCIFYTFKLLSINYEQVRFATLILPIWLLIVYNTNEQSFQI